MYFVETKTLKDTLTNSLVLYWKKINFKKIVNGFINIKIFYIFV